MRMDENRCILYQFRGNTIEKIQVNGMHAQRKSIKGAHEERALERKSEDLEYWNGGILKPKETEHTVKAH